MLIPKKRSKNLANDLEDLQLKISVRDKLININNSQLNNLTSIINNQNDRIADLEIDLVNLKTEYEKIIYNSYKKRSAQMKLMFLFASEKCKSGFKRFQYFKQYSKYRKKQADRIVQVQNEIEDTVDSLVIIKNQKQKIIEENEDIKQLLSKEKKQQDDLFDSLLKNQNNYAAQINEKEKQAKLIDNEIEKLIRLAITESNKQKIQTNFALTPEGRIVSSNFQANRGRLPWPVKEGVIVRRFGTHHTLL